ncbi:hypothetical protein BCIN_01g07430 [Botrytis cinerea B05.10]|uniref:Uncharacterized protein n=3 Tax=Botryotinia fuckeliana TaxID=40559 RepID=A0A384J6D2_BOTFB|nr:hypothetical protein BCIN_01g07430 [Botrytis cinerea B05.10]ATZ46072.1 hypothetical protein BCIN_01g07430 [Botrytis cinerea B05.10]EMR84431.1 hypothetical protein BcDW1_6941 [Botrytis cinerea BcDW1]CCD45790.1 hypothetical protein BofuT4_P048080.1 [Botrytis cinerea T4]
MDDDAGSLISSQDSVPDMDFVERANRMMADTKKRRDAKRNKIENERGQRIKEVKKKLGVLYENKRIQRAKLQRAQWRQLHSLDKKRQELERHILDSMKIVESNTLSIAREFNAVILKRLSAMENLTDTQDAA